jgi:hypothetical protein
MPQFKTHRQTVERTRIRRVEERDLPEPSDLWLTAAFFFLGCAVTTVTAALTLSRDAVVSPSVLWITTPWPIFVAGLCFLAHIDVNRGRRVKRYEIEEGLNDA